MTAHSQQPVQPAFLWHVFLLLPVLAALGNQAQGQQKDRYVFPPATSENGIDPAYLNQWKTQFDRPAQLSSSPKKGTGHLPQTDDERRRNLLQRIVVDPEKKRQETQQIPPPKPVDPVTTYLKENQQSEVSPSHWGIDATVPDSNFSGTNSVYESLPNDPPVYDPEKDPNRPRKSFREVWYHGRKFSIYDLLYFEPRYRRNQGLLIEETGVQNVVSTDSELDLANRIGWGFESKSGPGFEMYYVELDQASSLLARASTTSTLRSRVFLPGSGDTLTLSTASAGQSMAVRQSTDLQYFDATLFKFLKFPVAALVGHIGIRYAEIDHQHEASLFDGTNTVIGVLSNESDFKGFGPKIGITYVRPIGHTRFRMVGAMSGSILAGDLEQAARLSGPQRFLNNPSEQFVTAFDIKLGVEWVYNVTDSTSFYARMGYESQHWFNAGSPIDPNSSFGLSGMAFGIGLNR